MMWSPCINDNLLQQAQAIFKSWFVDFEPFGGVMPADWRMGTLAEVCSLIAKGITPKYTDSPDYRVINQKCIRNHTIDLSLSKTCQPKNNSEKEIRYGDLLINSTGEGTLGRAAQVTFVPQNITVDSHVTIVRPIDTEFICFLGLWGTSHERAFEMMSTGSTGQTDLPRDRLKEMDIIIPTSEILDKFSAIVTPINQKIQSNNEECSNLALLRDILLPKLMSGEIDVSDIRI